jgi:XTP/dITP diphosphohydrolase
MKLIFATNNQHKVTEVKAALPEGFSVLSLKEAGIDIDIPEPYDTLEENAEGKARTVFNMLGTDCFSEDTGLEVYSLHNEPGVHSARYAGEEKSFEKNIDKILSELKGHENRKARFRAVFCLILDNKDNFFEGVCEGEIIKEKRGAEGFGYDPVFIPAGSTKTFAEMSMMEKISLSHRKKALDNMVAFLKNLTVNKQY